MLPIPNKLLGYSIYSKNYEEDVNKCIMFFRSDVGKDTELFKIFDKLLAKWGLYYVCYLTTTEIKFFLEARDGKTEYTKKYIDNIMWLLRNSKENIYLRKIDLCPNV